MSKDKTPVDMNYLFSYQFSMYSQNVSVCVLRGSHVKILAVPSGVFGKSLRAKAMQCFMLCTWEVISFMCGDHNHIIILDTVHGNHLIY